MENAAGAYFAIQLNPLSLFHIMPPISRVFTGSLMCNKAERSNEEL